MVCSQIRLRPRTSDATHERNANCEECTDVVDRQPVSLLKLIGVAAHGLFASIICGTMLMKHRLDSITPDRASSVLKVSDVGLVCVFRHGCEGERCSAAQHMMSE
jgi:hypothetical protein